MAPPFIPMALGAGAVLGLGETAYNAYLGNKQFSAQQQWNKQSLDFAERQYRSQMENNFWNQGFQARQLNQQQSQFRENMNWQQHLARNAMQYRVQDLKRAGINPAIAGGVTPISAGNISTSPVGGTSGISGGSPSFSGGYSPQLSSGLSRGALNAVISAGFMDLQSRRAENEARLWDLKAQQSKWQMDFQEAKRAERIAVGAPRNYSGKYSR